MNLSAPNTVKHSDSVFHTTQAAISSLPSLYKEFVPFLIKQGKIVVDNARLEPSTEEKEP